MHLILEAGQRERNFFTRFVHIPTRSLALSRFNVIIMAGQKAQEN